MININFSRENLEKRIIQRLLEEKDKIKLYWNNKSFNFTRHLIIDDFLPEDIANVILDDFLKQKNLFKEGKYILKQKKNTLADISNSSNIIKDFYSIIHDNNFIEEISKITGMTNLKSDETLYAGGLTIMKENDYLNPHIDNSHNSSREMYRRINLLFYLNHDWQEMYGGNLELWNDKVNKKKTIISKFNRLVIMETNKKSYHSVSKVKTNKLRCCISTYYFSKESPDNTNYFHVTSFIGRPEEKFIRLLSNFDNKLRKMISYFLKFGRNK